ELNRPNIVFRKNAVDDITALQRAAEKLGPLSSASGSTTGPSRRAEVLRQRAQEDQSVALLFDRADRLLPQLHLQEELPNPQALQAQLRAGAMGADGAQDLRDLRPAATRECPASSPVSSIRSSTGSLSIVPTSSTRSSSNTRSS